MSADDVVWHSMPLHPGATRQGSLSAESGSLLGAGHQSTRHVVRYQTLSLCILMWTGIEAGSSEGRATQ